MLFIERQKMTKKESLTVRDQIWLCVLFIVWEVSKEEGESHMKRKCNPPKLRSNVEKEEYQPTENLLLEIGAGRWWRSQPLLEKEVCEMACTGRAALRSLGGCGLLAGGKQGHKDGISKSKHRFNLYLAFFFLLLSLPNWHGKSIFTAV